MAERIAAGLLLTSLSPWSSALECIEPIGLDLSIRGHRELASELASLSNRTLLVNNLLDLALYAGNRVVSAVGMKPPHDGRSRVRPPKVLCAVRIGRTEPTRMASPTSRQGHRDSTSEEYTNTVNSLSRLMALWR